MGMSSSAKKKAEKMVNQGGEVIGLAVSFHHIKESLLFQSSSRSILYSPLHVWVLSRNGSNRYRSVIFASNMKHANIARRLPPLIKDHTRIVVFAYHSAITDFVVQNFLIRSTRAL